MSVTLVYDEATRTAVTVDATGLPAVGFGDVTAIVQRSTDAVRYRTVRGLAEAVLSAGAIPETYDWEFGADVLNTYRAGLNEEAVDTYTRSVASGWGTTDTGQAWTASGSQYSVDGAKALITHTAASTVYDASLPSPASVGDCRLQLALSLSVGSVTGASMRQRIFAHYVDSNNSYRLSVDWATSGALNVACASKLAGVDTIRQSVTLPFGHAGSSTTVRVRMLVEGTRIRARFWSAAGAEPSTWTIDVTIPAAAAIASGIFLLQSGRDTGNTNTDPATTWDDFVVYTGNPVWLMSSTITPTLSQVWLKSVMRSFLSIAPNVTDHDEPARGGRGSESYVSGRTLPVAQSELMTGRRLNLRIRAGSLAIARQWEYLIASGDVLFLHTPVDCGITGGYFRVDAMTSSRPWARGASRSFVLPLIEVAAPGPDIITAQSTWDTVIALYGTWADVVSAQPTWEDLLDLVGDPSEVIVP